MPNSARVGPAIGADRVTLLGCFRLWVAGDEVVLPTGAQRLVALLALRGRMTRSRAAGTLWPESPEDRALASLRTAIWRINQIAPGLVAVAGGAIDLRSGGVVDVRDLVRGARALIEGGEAAVAAPREFFPDEPADLLPDWEDSWLEDERERLRQLRLHVQEALAERLATQGRFGLALEAALTALRSDVLRESAHRSVIRIHLAEGNIAEARRAYAACRRVLEQELGVAPTLATTRMLALPPEPSQPMASVGDDTNRDAADGGVLGPG